MRSDLMKEGSTRAPHRSLLRALGLTDDEDVASTQKVPAALEAPVIDSDQDVEHEDTDRKEA